MLAFNQLHIKRGKRNLFTIDALALTSGLVALVGRNGAGKSTFFKTIMGIHTDFTGEIRINNQEISDYSIVELAKKIAVVYSKSTVFGNHTGYDVLMLGRLPYQNTFAIVSDKDREIVDTIIASLQIENFVNKRFANLSDGEKQLVMIGRAMVQETPIIILDEPSAFLDLVNKHQLMQILKAISEQTNKLVLFSTHEINFLETLCDSVLLIEKEKMIQLTDQNEFMNTIHTSFGMKKNGSDEI